MRSTSKEAYQAVLKSGMFGHNMLLVYKTLFEFGPLTQTECCIHAESLDSANRKADLKQSLSTCFSKLRRYGIVIETGKRKCKITGFKCIEWDVTKFHPEKPKPFKSLKIQIKDLIESDVENEYEASAILQRIWEMVK